MFTNVLAKSKLISIKKNISIKLENNDQSCNILKWIVRFKLISV